jgi:hypothetical protein
LLALAIFLAIRYYRNKNRKDSKEDTRDVEMRPSIIVTGDIDDVVVLERLGGGAFSDVYRGVMKVTYQCSNVTNYTYIGQYSCSIKNVEK